MSDERRQEVMEQDPVALHKNHDTVAQQRAEKEEKVKHIPCPPITPIPTRSWRRKEVTQK